MADVAGSPGESLEEEPLADPQWVACQSALSDALESRARSLAASTQVGDRIGAVLLRHGNPADFSARANADYYTGLTNALRDNPTDALGRWLQADACLDAPGCDALRASGALVHDDPDNLAAWLLAMEAARVAGHPEQLDSLLTHAARARIMDTHAGDTAMLVLRSAGDTLPAECRPVAQRMLALDRPATGEDLAVGIAIIAIQWPRLSALMELCSARQGIAERHLADCRRVYARMAAADDLLPVLLGTRALSRIAESPGERRRWHQAWREVAWIQRQGGPLLTPELLPVVWESGEVPVLRTLLQTQGRWPPPAEWDPSIADQRAQPDPAKAAAVGQR